jgi:acetyl esterase/lipase
MLSWVTSLPYYDPEVRAEIEAGGRLGTVNSRTLEAARRDRLLNNDDVPLSDAVTRTDVFVPGETGHQIRLRVHQPVGATGLLPCVYWMHGGGYVLGSPEQDDLRFDRWCQRFNMVGVAVQYRLAPEHPYPAALDDSYAGLAWVTSNGEQLGADTSSIGIGGPSGGGGLAAALGLAVRDRAEFEIAFQLLIYPMIDDRGTTTSSQWDVPIWSPESNAFGWASYLGDLSGTDEVPPHAAPSRADDLSGLPPTYIMCGGLDGFVDEDIDYATRLNQAGVNVELHIYPGAPHGFEGFAPNAAVSRQARRDLNQWLGRVLSH